MKLLPKCPSPEARITSTKALHSFAIRPFVLNKIKVYFIPLRSWRTDDRLGKGNTLNDMLVRL
jgi:ribosome-binding factor A